MNFYQTPTPNTQHPTPNTQYPIPNTQSDSWKIEEYGKWKAESRKQPSEIFSKLNFTLMK